MTREKRFYEFGPFRLDAESRALLREGRAVALTPRVFDILVALVEHRDRVVGREELMRKVWQDYAVEEANLTVSVSLLRKVLGEGVGGARYIETVPKRGYRFVAEVREISDTGGREANNECAGALAVLPFLVYSPREEDQYLGLGLVDALITRLSRIRQLVVRPTRAVVQYAGQAADPAEAGRELCADVVLAGSVRRAGDRLRVSVQLVGAHDGAVLWAEKLDHSFTDIFDCEDAISADVARALHLKLSGGQAARLFRRHTESEAAYRLYLQGRYFWNRRSPENLRRALRCFERAAEEDAGFALAYAGLADTYILMGGLPPREVMPMAKAAAARALELDDTLAEAHSALGFVRENYDWDFAGAEREFRRALELNPNYATARQWYAEHLAVTRRHDEGLAEIRKAQALDPLSLSVGNAVARQFYFARRFDEAAEQCRHILELDPSFLPARYRLGGTYVQMGRFEEAIGELRVALEISAGAPAVLAGLCYAYAVAGRETEARDVLARLLNFNGERRAEPGHLALIYVGLGAEEEALESLEKVFEGRYPLIAYLAVEPVFDPLRDDPRFNDLLRRIGHEI